MVEKSIPSVTVKKIDRLHFNASELDGQRSEFARRFNSLSFLFDGYEEHYLKEYLSKYCKV